MVQEDQGVAAPAQFLRAPLGGLRGHLGLEVLVEDPLELELKAWRLLPRKV